MPKVPRYLICCWDWDSVRTVLYSCNLQRGKSHPSDQGWGEQTVSAHPPGSAGPSGATGVQAELGQSVRLDPLGLADLEPAQMPKPLLAGILSEAPRVVGSPLQSLVDWKSGEQIGMGQSEGVSGKGQGMPVLP